MFDSLPLEYASSQEPCVTIVSGEKFNQFGYAIAGKKGDPLIKDISKSLSKLRSTGVMEKLYTKWFTGVCTNRGMSIMSDNQISDFFCNTD